jgi:hypothetical protein
MLYPPFQGELVGIQLLSGMNFIVFKFVLAFSLYIASDRRAMVTHGFDRWSPLFITFIWAAAAQSHWFCYSATASSSSFLEVSTYYMIVVTLTFSILSYMDFWSLSAWRFAVMFFFAFKFVIELLTSLRIWRLSVHLDSHGPRYLRTPNKIRAFHFSFEDKFHIDGIFYSVHDVPYFTGTRIIPQ